MKTWRILIVEDELTIARAHERLIRRILPDADITAVDSGESAIAILAAVGFDLVISDFNLRGMATGEDVLAASRMLVTQPAFLFVTSSDRAAELGAPHLDKPCRPADLKRAIAIATIRAPA